MPNMPTTEIQEKYKKEFPLEHFICDDDPYYKCQVFDYPDRECNCGAVEKYRRQLLFIEDAYTLGQRAAIESLEAIEHIVASDECADIEYKLAMDRFDSPTEKSMAEMLGQIYKIAHSSNPKHTCYDVHQNWRDEIKSLKESDNGSAQEE